MDVFSNNTQELQEDGTGTDGVAESRYRTAIDRRRPAWPGSSSRHNINEELAEPFLRDYNLCAGDCCFQCIGEDILYLQVITIQENRVPS